jgi:hypothetical protein
MFLDFEGPSIIQILVLAGDIPSAISFPYIPRQKLRL